MVVRPKRPRNVPVSDKDPFGSAIASVSTSLLSEIPGDVHNLLRDKCIDAAKALQEEIAKNESMSSFGRKPSLK